MLMVPAPEMQPKGNYDAHFFDDDDLALGPGLFADDDDDFADAQEMLSPDVEGADGLNIVDAGSNAVTATIDSQDKGLEFGSQLVTSNRRVRPEYVQYARVAKKVDVRRLKETLWKGMLFE